jgi:hypothetical protein
VPDRREHSNLPTGTNIPPITTELALTVAKDLLEQFETSRDRLPNGDLRRSFARYASHLRQRIREYEAGGGAV